MKTPLLTCLGVALFACCASSNAAAQSASANSGKSSVEQQLQQILEATRRVRETLRDGEERTFFTEEDKTDGLTLVPPEVESTLPATAAPKNPAESVQEIRERIELLRRLREKAAEEAAIAANQANSSPDGGLLISTNNPDAESQVQPDSSAIESVQENIENAPEEATPAPIPQIGAKKILGAPVDAVQLGENLYRTKNYNAALKALETVDLASLSETDRVWIELLTALTQRRLGDVEAAEAKLREISNIKSRDRSVPVARWWLKQTELMRDTRPLLDQISSELDILIERSKENAEPTN